MQERVRTEVGRWNKEIGCRHVVCDADSWNQAKIPGPHARFNATVHVASCDARADTEGRVPIAVFPSRECTTRYPAQVSTSSCAVRVVGELGGYMAARGGGGCDSPEVRFVDATPSLPEATHLVLHKVSAAGCSDGGRGSRTFEDVPGIAVLGWSACAGRERVHGQAMCGTAHVAAGTSGAAATDVAGETEGARAAGRRAWALGRRTLQEKKTIRGECAAVRGRSGIRSVPSTFSTSVPVSNVAVSHTPSLFVNCNLHNHNRASPSAPSSSPVRVEAEPRPCEAPCTARA
ncbi:hypothetical protein OF83DRAFT_1179534 [Amylostereum chailletii]|nr:hypothetical protein OF83DRAFT_1179534 [Amylostereum chailletii]